MTANAFRQRLIGALLCLSVLALLAGTVPGTLPLLSPLGTVARVLDSVAPQMLGLALVLSLLAALLGAWRMGGALAVVIMALTGWFSLQHVQRSLPVADTMQSDVRVIFFNVLSENVANAERIRQAASESGADVLAFAESEALGAVLPQLRTEYPYDSGCQKHCRTLVLSKLPLEPTNPDEGPMAWDGRLVSVTVTPTSGVPFTLIVAHKLKPWFAGQVELQDTQLQTRTNAIAGPLVVVGDFNAAPWSAPSRELIDATGLRAPRVPVPTWPVEAGRFGVPIDNIFVRGGARLTGLQPFGDDLGSNHRGLLAEVAISG
ncbi:endonuclease/exonuclease/phosphatase family protein [Frigidibacter mobilis]|uniref:Endonuclease/exonuclease/phosphatase family protein n=1 Tax=Frigidibacter mobilis TaxID=1335048 RepID=A0A159Z6N1_9RHOB|nr:endonuclease/exonuclease/phosphatase family protein [Frigidibacter mobilis]AMY70114.1 endonuclease/exonuclease/phosphatase family protein [Frigidibacter mobilis]